MFAQTERLDRAAFTHAYTHGKKVHMPGFLLVSMTAPTRKVAVVVGKRVVKRAVARNLLKRRLYAALHEANTPNSHLILIAKPAALAYSYAKLKTEVVTALGRAVGENPRSR